MTKAEMHNFEKAMMGDPLLSDAVDGYREILGRTNITQDITDLSTQIKDSPAKVVKGSFKQWMSIAAGFIILLSVSVVLYRIFQQKETAGVVQTAGTAADTSSTTTSTKVDSNTLAIQEAGTTDVQLSPEPKPVIIPSLSKSMEKKKVQELPLAATEPVMAVPPREDVKINEQRPAAAAVKDHSFAKQEPSSNRPAADNEYTRLHRFNGKIVDENNNPLPFANITEINSGVGTYADVNGNFVLLSADSVLNVQTRSLGYASANSQIRMNTGSRIVLRDEPAVANAPSPRVLYERSRQKYTRADSDTTFDELYAEPYDGWNNYNVYVNNNMRNPSAVELNKKTLATGEVELSFDVNPDGSLTNIKIERSTCRSCNNEAIRLLKEGPKWKTKSGKKEHAKFTVRF